MGLGWIFWSLQLSEKWQMRRARDEEEREGTNEMAFGSFFFFLNENVHPNDALWIHELLPHRADWAGRGEERVMGHLCLSHITNAWNKISCAGKVQRLGLPGRSLTAFSISADYMNINQGRSEKNVNLQRKHCQEQVAGWRNAGLIWLCDYHGTRTIYSQNLIILQWEMGIRNWQNSHQKAEVAKSDKAWAALKWRRPSNFPGGIGSSDLAKKPSGAGPPLACLLPNRTDPSIYLHQIFPQSKHYQGNSSYRSARGLGDILLRVRAWTLILADQERDSMAHTSTHLS